MARPVKTRLHSIVTECPEIEGLDRMKCLNHSSTVVRAVEAFLASQKGLEQTISLLKRDFREADTEWEDLVMDLAGENSANLQVNLVAIEIGKKLTEVRKRNEKRDALSAAITSRRPRTKPAPKPKPRRKLK